MTDQPTTDSTPTPPPAGESTAGMAVVPAKRPSSPALSLAERLIALARHLRHSSTLPNVDIDGRPYMDGIDLDLMIAGLDAKGETRGAAAVLQWARTLTDPVIELQKDGGAGARVVVVGGLGAFRARVWDVDRGDLRRLVIDGKPTRFPMQKLVDYVAAGNVHDAEAVAR